MGMASSYPTTGRFQRCPQHPAEELKFFCETHDAVCCMACSVLLHKQCNNVVYIPDVANYKSGPEYKRLTEELNKTQQLALQYLTDIEENMKAVEQLKTEETTKLEKYRSEIKKYVDRRFNKLTSRVTKLQDKAMSLLKDKHTETSTVVSNIATTKTKLETCEESPNELLIESKNTLNVVAQLQVALANIAKTKYQVYSVRKDDQMEAVLKNKVGIATIKPGKTTYVH